MCNLCTLIGDVSVQRRLVLYTDTGYLWCLCQSIVFRDFGRERPGKIASDDGISRRQCGVLGVVFN